MRVGIVNDLRLAAEVLRRVVASQEDCEVAWVAADGREALAACLRDRPDLVLMDIVMPGMDGVEATRRIMREAPCPILVVTATVEGNLSKVYDALGAGALDAVDGPGALPDGTLTNLEPLVRKIRTVRRLGSGAWPPAAEAAPPEAAAPAVGTDLPIVAVGASTGGPEALARLLGGLPPAFPPPVLVVQHLDAQFVPGFVEWLRQHAGRDVAAIQQGDDLRPGVVQVAASADHLVLRRDGRLGYEHEPAGLAFRPSVDVFFASLARSGRPPGVAAVLTGMGRDGAQGLLALRRAGWATFAQDEATSVVYGMPRAALDVEAAREAIPIDTMGVRVHGAWERQCARQARGEGA